MYSEDDIRTVDAEALVRNRPEMYFGSEEPSALLIAEAIRDDAVTLGADCVEISSSGSWTLVRSSSDWLEAELALRFEAQESGASPLRFSSLRQNDIRGETLAQLWSDAAVTWSTGETIILRGGEIAARFAEENMTPIWCKRVFAFRFLRYRDDV
ncbi:MAG: hypothetical protein AAF680_00230 [Pseudomonadota bacterium]